MATALRPAVSGPTRSVGAVTGWWFAPVVRRRITALRLLAYLFVPVDVALTAGWLFQHPDLAAGLYRPLLVARLLHLPAPTPALVAGLRAVLLAAALAAVATTLAHRGRLVRVAGAVTAVAYLWWMVVAMGYGKVDHDRFAYLVLLAVLPTAGAGRDGERRLDPATGWAVRTTQVAVVATYFLAGWAKVRVGGWGWVNGATLAWAVVRRGTVLSRWALDVPLVLRGAQWIILGFELASPLLLVVRNQRRRLLAVAALYAFHLLTFATVGIVFLPHMVALAAFLPLERVTLRPRLTRVASGW